MKIQRNVELLGTAPGEIVTPGSNHYLHKWWVWESWYHTLLKKMLLCYSEPTYKKCFYWTSISISLSFIMGWNDQLFLCFFLFIFVFATGYFIRPTNLFYVALTLNMWKKKPIFFIEHFRVIFVLGIFLPFLAFLVNLDYFDSQSYQYCRFRQTGQ